jgi:hypothetical protein
VVAAPPTPQTTQRRYILRPIPPDASFSVAARSTRQLQIQVTDENDRPVPDLPILFSLGDPCLGSLGLGAGASSVLKEKTDNRGVAAVPWVAGAAKCAGTILARVEGTEFTYTYRVQVGSAPPAILSPRYLIPIAGGGIGGGLLIYELTKDDTQPIRAVPPPRVTPGATTIR